MRLRARQLDAVARELDRRARAARATAASRSARCAASRPATAPGTAHDAGADPEGLRRRRRRSRRRSPPSRPRARRGARRDRATATKKSSEPVGPVACAMDEHEAAGARARERALGDPATANAAATQASTALPPSASTRAPASAVSGCPAAIAPFMRASVERLRRASELQRQARASRLAGALREVAQEAGRLEHVVLARGRGVARMDGERPAARRSPPSPVATTVTQIWPFSRSSIVAPKMMFVSSTAPCADDLGRLVHLEQRQVVAAGDREQDPAGAAELGVDQRASAARARPPRGRGSRRSRSRSPSARAGVLHDRADVGEVEVDQARHS